MAWIWALAVMLLLAHGASLWLGKKLVPDADMLALLPVQERDPVLQQAFGHMVDKTQQKLIALVGAGDWDKARRAADAYRAVLVSHPDVFQLTDATAEDTQREWLATFAAHRALLMTPQDEDALRTRSAQSWIDGALAKLYSPFAGPKLGSWQDDPFGLFGDWLQARAQETPVRPRDGRLFVADGERPYVVMPVTLRVPAFSMDAQSTVIPVLDQARAAALKEAGADVLASGVVLHAAAAGAHASREASVIGIGSLIGIVLLTWLSFRSFKPIALVLLSVGIGCLGALSVCSIVFERLHLLTLVFGASLIGVAQDYGIFFLCNRLAADEEMDSVKLLRRLLPGLVITLATTLVGYAALALTPFPGLRQMAVFSTLGLIFAWLTVLCWFPVFVGPRFLKDTVFARRYGASLQRWPLFGNNRASIVAAVLVSALAVFGWLRLSANDDIRLLQNSPAELLAEQIKIGKLLDAPAPAQFYLVRGASAEAVLQREEVLKQKLDALIARHVIGGYQALSNWVPSARAQEQRRQLIAGKLLADGAALPGLAEKVGESAQWVSAARERLSATPVLTAEAFMNSPASEPWRHLWLGKTGEVYAGIVALRGVDRAALRELPQAAQGLEGVQWVDKVDEISSVLGRYRVYMGWTLLFSYVAVYMLLYLRYRRAAWRVLLPTALASIVTLAVLTLAGQPLQLFHMLGLMLLLGIGVDYGVFLHERPARRGDTAWLAVGLSAVNTLLGFGLLALSSTPALRAFGLTMLIGTTLVWLCVPCFPNEAQSKTAPVPKEEMCAQE
jgi:predicted exporter